MGIDIDPYNTGLVLGLGLSVESYTTPKKQIITAFDHQDHPHHHQFGNCKLISDLDHHHQAQPSLTLSLSGDDHHHHQQQTYTTVIKRVDHDSDNLIINKQSAIGFHNNDQISGDVSAASSLSNVSVKREREVVISEDDVEMEKKVISSSRVVVNDELDDDGSNGTRKKLRLTKAQSALLEESFKHHSTLNPKQKQDLARELKLRPRQVEVWFQNRRARTKLKQTEVDCEFLKKYCETLTEENRRLQKELQELKTLKLAAHQPLYMQLPAATLTMCPSCERIGGGGAGEVAGGGAAKSPLTMADLNINKPPPTHFYNPFTTDPSSAC